MGSAIRPCARCGAGRPANTQIVVEVNPDLMPIFVERIEEGGLCVDCARKDLDVLVLRGRVHQPIRRLT